MRIATDIVVTRDGSGSLAVTVVLDEELYGALTADGFDPFAGLTGTPGSSAGFRVASAADGRGVEVAASFPEPQRLGRLVAQLGEGLSTGDPVVLDDFDLAVDPDGGARLSGRAGLRPPTTTGVDGPGITFDGDALAALLDQPGQDGVRHDLRVVFPGEVVDADADIVDGRVATWRLPVTGLRSIRAVAAAPKVEVDWAPVAAVGLGTAAAVFAAVTVGAGRRRGVTRSG
jgi:hypothetical protein